MKRSVDCIYSLVYLLGIRKKVRVLLKCTSYKACNSVWELYKSLWEFVKLLIFTSHSALGGDDLAHEVASTHQ